MIKRLLYVLVTVFLAACASSFDVQGHRGARGLAPENTLPAFTKALELGVTTLELDVGVTADDVLVIAHDPYLNANLTRDANGVFLQSNGPSLRSLTYAQLQQYDVGRLKPDSGYAKQFPLQQAVDKTAIPRLRDLFALVAARSDRTTRFNIETKIRPDRPQETADAQTFVRLLLQLVREYGLQERVAIQSFDWRTLQLVQAQAPGITTVYLTVQQSWFNNVAPAPGTDWLAGMKSASNLSVAHLVKQAGGKVWSPYYKDITAASVREAQSLGLKVIPWTVNLQAEMKSVIEMGVNGLISDRPDLLLPLVR